MMLNRRVLTVILANLLMVSLGSDAFAQRKTLCVGPIVSIGAIKAKAARAGKALELDQMIQTLDSTLVDQLNGTRKFDVVARKDALRPLMDEQDFGDSGNVDPATAAKIMKLAGAQYMLMTTVTDFVYGTENLKFEGIGVEAKRETVRVSCSVQIYDTTTGKLLESARFRGTDVLAKGKQAAVAGGEVLTRITDNLASDIMNSVINVIYPARVVAILGDQITINRGAGTGIAVDQSWGVYAQGEALIDPDTGENLGSNEAQVGLVTIKRVEAKLSFAEAVENNGIEKLAIVRLKAEAKPKPAGDKPPAKGSLIDRLKDDF